MYNSWANKQLLDQTTGEEAIWAPPVTLIPSRGETMAIRERPHNEWRERGLVTAVDTGHGKLPGAARKWQLQYFNKFFVNKSCIFQIYKLFFSGWRSANQLLNWVEYEGGDMCTAHMRTPMLTGQCPLDVGTSLMTPSSPWAQEGHTGGAGHQMSVGRRSPSGQHIITHEGKCLKEERGNKRIVAIS